MNANVLDKSLLYIFMTVKFENIIQSYGQRLIYLIGMIYRVYFPILRTVLKGYSYK